jgi:hypothetical protein
MCLGSRLPETGLIHLLIVLMGIFLPFSHKSQKLFENYDPEMRTFT